MRPSIEKMQATLIQARKKPVFTVRGAWDEVLRHAKNECGYEQIMPGVVRSTAIRPEIRSALSALPGDAIKRIELLVDSCAQYSGIEMFGDRWGVRHSRRRRWRNNLPAKYQEGGAQLKSFFKDNKLAANKMQNVMSAARVAERGMQSAPDVLEQNRELQAIMPHIGAIMDICGGRGEFQVPDSALTRDQRKRIMAISTNDTVNDNFATRYMKMGMPEKEAVAGYLLNEVDSILEILTLKPEKA